MQDRAARPRTRLAPRRGCARRHCRRANESASAGRDVGQCERPRLLLGAGLIRETCGQDQLLNGVDHGSPGLSALCAQRSRRDPRRSRALIAVSPGEVALPSGHFKVRASVNAANTSSAGQRTLRADDAVGSDGMAQPEDGRRGLARPPLTHILCRRAASNRGARQVFAAACRVAYPVVPGPPISSGSLPPRDDFG